MKKVISFVLVISLVLAGSLGLTACEANTSTPGQTSTDELDGKTKYQDMFYDYFDTVSIVVGYEEDEETFNQAAALVEEKLEYYNDLYDIYHTYEGVTNVCNLNSQAAEGPVEVSEDLMDLLKFGKEVYETTDGMTNIAFGAVLSIWHQYRENGINNPDQAALPDMSDLEDASQHCNIDDLVLDEENMTVYYADPDLRLDVGAIAKGYATARIAEDLEAASYTGYALNFGGNVTTVGAKPDGSDWIAGIQNPDTESDEAYVAKVYATDISVVTSGSYQRYYEVDGVRYHHIIDPDTLMPENNFLSVSVMTKDSGLGDGLSTALFNMSYEDGKALVDSLDGVEALWIFPDQSQKYTDGFTQYLVTE